jgi:hypothetical protein
MAIPSEGEPPGELIYSEMSFPGDRLQRKNCKFEPAIKSIGVTGATNAAASVTYLPLPGDTWLRHFDSNRTI